MLASITVIGFIFTLAWIQQIFLNRMMAADLEYLRSLPRHTLKDR
ncbi:MAG: hypothetical protein AAFX78_00135 [Cyanobacteria bacterium J06638_20]